MNKTLLHKTFRDLRAARAQSLALIFIVALGIASYIALIGSYRDLGASYKSTYDRLRFADVTFAVSEAPASVLDEIADVAGVTAVTGRLIIDTGYELPNGDQIRARLIGMPADGQPDANQLLIEDGRTLQPTDSDAVILESHFAKFYNLEPGDTVTPIINGQKTALTIVGVGTSPEYLIVSPSQQDILPSARTFAVLFLPLDALQNRLETPDAINNIAIRHQPDADQTKLIAEIQTILEPYQLEATTLQKDVPSNAALQEDLAGFGEISGLMPGLILLVAAISVYVMLGRLVRSQQPQIGLMKALGYSNRVIMLHYLTFSLIIGGTGLILGLLAGPPLAKAITGSYAAELGIPLVETRFYPDLVATSVLLSLLVVVLAGIGPARSSARLAPAEAMRLDPSVALVDGRRSFIERLLPIPFNWRLPLRNVFRMRRRSFTTGLGIIFAFILVLMSWGMLDSMNYMLDTNFNQIEQWDAIAIFDQPQTAAVLDVVRSWEGVTAVEPTIQLPATIKENDHSEDVLLTAFSPEQTMHVLRLADGLTPEEALGDGRIILTIPMADKLGLNIGDDVTLDTPFGTHTLILGGVTEEMMTATAYIAYDDAQKLSPLPTEIFNGLYLTLEPAQAQTIKNDLYHLPGAASVQLKSDIIQDWQSFMGLFYAFMGVMLLFALAMAFALLFNAVTVNVLERQRELATMRAIGASGGQIARQIMAENTILWLLTLIPGLLLGTWVAMQMGAAFSAELFSFQIVISPTSYVFTALGILAIMLLAAIPAIHRINHLDLAEATKVLT